MIVRAHEDVVDVQQDAAIGAAGELGQKLVLRHVAIEHQVAGGVLQQNPPSEPLLHDLHPARHVGQHLLGVRQRQQIVRVDPVRRPPAKVVGDPGRLDSLRQRASSAR